MSGIFTKCSSGGTCLSVEYTDKVGELAKKHGLKLHIDGARIFNASVVSKSFSICYFCHRILLCGKFFIHVEVGEYVTYRKIKLQMNI
jgi:threonine aldolase